MPRLWIHIGAPKSGTTSLQRYLAAHRAELFDLGLNYLTPEGKTSANPVAVALNRQREAELALYARQFADAVEGPAINLLSSEMLFGMGPEDLSQVLPAMSPEATDILVYLRRQDRYLESKYVQKLKNGRFSGSIHDYIEKFGGSGADYTRTLAPWRDAGCRVHVRICEEERLTGGSVVSDAIDVLGIEGAPVPFASDERSNASPSRVRLQLLDAARKAGVVNLVRLQRRLPPDEGSAARFFTADERREVLARYDASNRLLKDAFFPDAAQLFATDDLDAADTPDDESFSPRQLTEIETVMRALLDTR